jgi:hypothetical protein
LKDYFDMSEKEVEDEMAQIAAETALQQPAIQEAVAKNAMVRMGMQQQLQALEEAQSQVVKGNPPIQQSKGFNIGQRNVATQGRVGATAQPVPTPAEQEQA